jgi:hypothetical protein
MSRRLRSSKRSDRLSRGAEVDATSVGIDTAAGRLRLQRSALHEGSACVEAALAAARVGF